MDPFGGLRTTLERSRRRSGRPGTERSGGPGSGAGRQDVSAVVSYLFSSVRTKLRTEYHQLTLDSN